MRAIVTQKMRDDILALRKTGMTYRAIGSRVGCSDSAAHAVVAFEQRKSGRNLRERIRVRSLPRHEKLRVILCAAANAIADLYRDDEA